MGLKKFSLFFILFLENVGSMSQDFTKEESHEQENLHNSWAYNTYETLTHSSSISTGKSLSEALIFASTNPQYDDRLFIELQLKYMKIPSSNHVLPLFCKKKSF